MMTRHRLALALPLIGALSIGLRLPFLSVPLTTDEAGYAYVVHWLGQGLVLYRDLWFDRPQGIFLVYTALIGLLGDSTEAIRFGAALYNAATTLCLYALASRLLGRRAGLAAAGTFAVASASPVIEGFTANGELFMNLPVVLSLLLATHSRPVAAGVLLAVAGAIKPTALPAAAPAVLVALLPALNRSGVLTATAGDRTWLVGAYRHTPSRRRWAYVNTPLQRLFVFGRFVRMQGPWWLGRDVLVPGLKCGAGLAIGLAPFIAHGLAIDPQTYWFSVAGFRAQAHSVFSAGNAGVRELLLTSPSVFAALLPVWLLAAAGLLGGGWRTRGGAIGLALLAGSLAGAAAGGYWYWHYYAGLLPGAALLAGSGLVRLYPSIPQPFVPQRERGALRGRSPGIVGHGWLVGGRRGEALAAMTVDWASAVRRMFRPYVAPATALVLASTAIIALVFNIRLVGATPEQTSWNLYRRPAYLASKRIAEYVRARTSESDRIYAAFAQADLYLLSHRRSAGNHLYWTEINRVPGAFEAVVAALDDPARRPKYVIGVDDDLEVSGRAARFWARVEQLYQRETTIGGFPIYRLRDG
ncbi:MAG: glycosyltransferase family 39 protein [Chloroflexi bacterium]|nr:glycosyltransferase family 39 protein [Chloroflexota bacterium]